MGLTMALAPAWAQKSLPGNPNEPVNAETLNYLVGLCEGCHGTGGHSQRDDVPSLAGRPAKQLFDEIERFYFFERLCPDVPVDAQDAARGHMSMCDVTSQVSRAEATALSEYFARQGKP
jgi:cytochrome c553